MPPLHEDVLQYHLRELEIARDVSHRNHLMPPIRQHHKTILDIGCGMGQTLAAANLPSDVQAYGIDRDAAAIEAGKLIVPPNIHLDVGTGECLRFKDENFDFIVCRVALPYMRIETALREMSRVLKPRGEVWLVLHAPRMLKTRAKNSASAHNYKDLLYCLYVACNSTCFCVSGKQMALKGRAETCQTELGMRRAFKHAGLVCTNVQRETFFVMEGRKI